MRDWVTLLVVVALLAACGADDVGPPPTNEPVPPPPSHVRGFDVPGALAAVDMWIHIDDIEIVAADERTRIFRARIPEMLVISDLDIPWIDPNRRYSFSERIRPGSDEFAIDRHEEYDSVVLLLRGGGALGMTPTPTVEARVVVGLENEEPVLMHPDSEAVLGLMAAIADHQEGLVLTPMSLLVDWIRLLNGTLVDPPRLASIDAAWETYQDLGRLPAGPISERVCEDGGDCPAGLVIDGVTYELGCGRLADQDIPAYLEIGMSPPVLQQGGSVVSAIPGQSTSSFVAVKADSDVCETDGPTWFLAATARAAGGRTYCALVADPCDPVVTDGTVAP